MWFEGGHIHHTSHRHPNESGVIQCRLGRSWVVRVKLDWKRSSRATCALTGAVARKTADGRYPGWFYSW
jgi:hypothetical protein